eukprot:m.173902 g.173902  ORF g.173902 m.173902 type:complete len:509 (+) comp15397_c0_seq8:109-1635(+)
MEGESESNVFRTLLLTLSVLVIGRILQIVVKFLLDRWKLRKIPTPPGALPIFGHALKLASGGAPWNKFIDWIDAYGRPDERNMITIQFLMKNAVVITDPKHLRQVMDKNQRNYPKELELSYKHFLHILGTGLVTSSGESWKRQRNLVSGALRFDILEDTADVAKRAVDRLSTKLASVKNIEIAEEFRVMTLQVIGELILSLTPEESERVFPKLYLPLVEEANKRVWAPWRKFVPSKTQFDFHRTTAALNSYVSDIIRKRWATRQEDLAAGRDPSSKDILDRVLSAVDPKTWGEETVRQLRDEIKTFLLAGHETSAAMLTWSIFELTQNPSCAQKLVAEAKAVFGQGRAKPSGGNEFESLPLPGKEKLADLQYTISSLKESLRLHTLVPVVAREALADDVIDGHTIPAGTKILINIKHIHLNEKLWKDPKQYQPERFQEKFEMYHFNAFINGPRNCLGQHLALLETRIVLALLMLRFKFTVVHPEEIKEHDFMAPIFPANGLNVKVEPV